MFDQNKTIKKINICVTHYNFVIISKTAAATDNSKQQQNNKKTTTNNFCDTNIVLLLPSEIVHRYAKYLFALFF